MSTPHEAPKRLPAKPSEENLKKQAKRRAKTDSIPLLEAQHRLAVEYGCRNWAGLMQLIEAMNRGVDVPKMSSSGVPNTPLQSAARNKDLDAVQRLLGAGQFTQDDLDGGLAGALWYGDPAKQWERMKAIADLLLEYGADPNGFRTTYGPIVFGTGECRQPESLQYLIDAGADVTFPPVSTKYGMQCPLSYWLGPYGRGDNDRKHRGVELLLKHGAFIPPEVTPPILAIHRGDAKTLSDLLDKDPSLLKRRFPDMPYGHIHLAGATLLHCAVELGEIECLDTLFQRYADINMKADVIDGVGGQTPVFHAINTTCDGNFYTLEYLANRVGKNIDMGVKATWRGQPVPLTPLEYAEKAQREADPQWAHQLKPRVKDELNLLRSLERRGQIKEACRRGDVAAVARMLDESPELFTPELWPPTIFQGRSYEVTKLLLDRGLNPNECTAPRRPLHLAVYQHLPDIVELLIQRGADVNQVNPLNERPLDLLDTFEPRPVGDPDARRIRMALLRGGAKDDLLYSVRAGDLVGVRRELDANPELIRGAEPLLTAARSGRIEMARLLIERGAAVDGVNAEGNTPLWFACQSPANAADRIAVATLLLEHGAAVRRACQDNSTALHFAAWRGPLAMVELLIRHGAKEWQEDKRHRKAIDHAREGDGLDREKIIELLDRPVIRDPIFRQAVATIQSGDLPALRQLLAEHPKLVHDRAVEPDCYPPAYFGNPRLLWFVANNPKLIETMPANSVEIAAAIIEAGAERADLDYTLGLVMTSLPARKQNLQRPLMKLLLDRGASVKAADLYGTLGHGERDAVAALLEGGLPLTAPIAAGMGMVRELAGMIASADAEQLHAALSLAVINRQLEAARLCLEAGGDPNRFLIVHAHSLPIHQAAVNDDVPMLKLLVEHGAKLDVRDTLWRGTPLGWAIHTEKPAAKAYLQSIHAP